MTVEKMLLNFIMGENLEETRAAAQAYLDKSESTKATRAATVAKNRFDANEPFRKEIRKALHSGKKMTAKEIGEHTNPQMSSQKVIGVLRGMPEVSCEEQKRTHVYFLEGDALEEAQTQDQE